MSKNINFIYGYRNSSFVFRLYRRKPSVALLYISYKINEAANTWQSPGLPVNWHVSSRCSSIILQQEKKRKREKSVKHLPDSLKVRGLLLNHSHWMEKKGGKTNKWRKPVIKNAYAQLTRRAGKKKQTKPGRQKRTIANLPNLYYPYRSERYLQTFRPNCCKIIEGGEKN